MMILLGAMACAAIIGGCTSSGAKRTVSVRELENALSGYPESYARVVISDPQQLDGVYRPLGPRLGLVVVSNDAEFRLLMAHCSALGKAPDFSRGKLVGVASLAGEPLDGEWPIELEDVQLQGGAGLVAAHFHSGSYLADGLALVDLAFVRHLDAVLIVDVNGVRYYP